MLIKVGVSRCLLGEKVRYDGTSKKCPEISQFIKHPFEIVPYCPEVSIGMGIPRLPIQLDHLNGRVHVRRKIDRSFDYTEKLNAYAEDFLRNHPDICGLISKKGSPSCGFKNAKLYESEEVISMHESGVFITNLLVLKPDLLIIDEHDFVNLNLRTVFLEKLKKRL